MKSRRLGSTAVSAESSNSLVGTAEPVSELVAPPHHGGTAQLAREDREAWECLEVERAGDEYMANLRRQNPERVAVEAAAYTMHEERLHDGGRGGNTDDDNLDFSMFDD
jgi:hypothetical protein